jgi:hypothetical protein
MGIVKTRQSSAVTQPRRERVRPATTIAHAVGPENGGFSHGGKAPMPAWPLAGSGSTPAFKTLTEMGGRCCETLKQKNLQRTGRLASNNILPAKFLRPADNRRIATKCLEESTAQRGANPFQPTGIIFK